LIVERDKTTVNWSGNSTGTAVTKPVGVVFIFSEPELSNVTASFQPTLALKTFRRFPWIIAYSKR
jgi:hypothetical protein